MMVNLRKQRRNCLSKATLIKMLVVNMTMIHVMLAAALAVNDGVDGG